MKTSNYKGEIKDVEVVTIGIVENYAGYYIAHHCSKCGRVLFQYKGRQVIELPGETPVQIPIILQCSNPTCSQKYLLSTILSR